MGATGCQGKRNRSAMGVAQNDGPVKVEPGKHTCNALCRCRQTRVDPLATLRLACAGKVKGYDVQIGTQMLDQRDKRFRTAHKAVEKDERGLIPGCPTPFEVGEVQALHANLAPFHHRFPCKQQIAPPKLA